MVRTCLVLLDIFSRAQNGPAQSCGLIRSSMQVIKDHFLQIGLYFLHLSQDHAALSLYLCFTQCAVLDNVSQDLYSCGGQNRGIFKSGGIVFFYTKNDLNAMYMRGKCIFP